MTRQVYDCIILDNIAYDIVSVKASRQSKSTIFDPRYFGFSPSWPYTGCWRGFLATYIIKNSKLVLLDLKINDNKNKNLRINGATPKSGFIFSNTYKNIYLAMSGFSGEITALSLFNIDSDSHGHQDELIIMEKTMLVEFGDVLIVR